MTPWRFVVDPDGETTIEDRPGCPSSDAAASAALEATKRARAAEMLGEAAKMLSEHPEERPGS